MNGYGLQDLEDVVGRINNLPSYICRSVFRSVVNYRHRLILASFAYGNGVHSEVLIGALYDVNPSMNHLKATQIRKLYEYWDDNFHNRSKRTYYDVTAKKVLDLNGNQVNIPVGNKGIRGLGC